VYWYFVFMGILAIYILSIFSTCKTTWVCWQLSSKQLILTSAKFQCRVTFYISDACVVRERGKNVVHISSKKQLTAIQCFIQIGYKFTKDPCLFPASTSF
jgi:hypothetical protein